MIDRDKPDYCYSDEENDAYEDPYFEGPFNEEIPDFYNSKIPEDDGKLTPLEELERLIDLDLDSD